MKILHVITTINRGGAENHLKDLIEGQLKLGADISCAYLKGDSYWAEYLKKKGCKVYHLEMNYYGQVTPIRNLRNVIKGSSPDILHAHLAPAELYSRFALLGNAKVPLITSRHNHHRFYSGLGAEIIEKWVVSRSQYFIGISESVKRHFSSQIPSLSDHFEVVHYGIDPELISGVPEGQIQALRSEWGIDKETILFGTVARLVSFKALHILLEGFARLRSENAALGVKLVLVGAGPLEADLKRRAAELKLSDSVVWAGFREDIPVVMNALDVFVLTSLSEGFGLVLLEAMSASKPVISTNVSALPEIVMEGKTGLMVSPGKFIALAEAMKLMREDVMLREQMGKTGYERVMSDFQLGVMCRKTMAVYERVL